eukprot:749282-Hanusia_phi.AAC.3
MLQGATPVSRRVEAPSLLSMREGSFASLILSQMFEDKIIGHSSAMNPLSNIYAEGDPQYEDKHLVPLDPIIVEGEGFLYGIRSVQIVALKEIVRGYDFVNVFR